MSQTKNIILSIIFAVALVQIHASSLDPKQEKLLELQYKTPIIELNETGYRHFVLNPTNYDIVVFYTSSKCDFCDKIYAEYQKAYQAYYSESASTVFDSEKGEKPVFFTKIVFSQAVQQFFFDLDMKSVPSIGVFDPQIVTVDEKSRGHYLQRRNWKISPSDGHVTVSKVIEYINKRTNRNIEYKEPLINVLSTIFIIISVIGGLLKLFFTFKPFFMQPNVQFRLALVIYFICMSGVVYNIIHNIPWTYTDEKGQIHWMADREGQGGRDQMGLEGVIMSGSISLAGVFIIMIQYFAKTQSLSPQLRVVFCLSCIFFAYMLTSFIEGIYRKKSWYDIRFYPPQHYIRGPLKRDQGLSF